MYKDGNASHEDSRFCWPRRLQEALGCGRTASGRHFATPNDDRGIKQLVKRLAALKPQLDVLEASGGNEFT